MIPGLGRSPGEENRLSTPVFLGFSYGSAGKESTREWIATPETWLRSLGWEDPLEKGKATHSSILTWGILGTV